MIYIALAAGLFLCSGASVAQQTSSDLSVFVGHYGETFEYNRLWKLEAFMQGPIEVIRLHPKDSEPGPDAYRPENFSDKQLIQLLVIPKDAPGGASSLEELKEARKADAAKAGTAPEIADASPSWPPGTFSVYLEKPYRLYQLYTQVGANFLILSSGVGERDAYPRPYIDIQRQHILDSLNASLPASPEPTTVLRGAALAFLFAQPFWKPWRWINGLCLILVGLGALLPKIGRVRLVALGMLLWGNAWTFGVSAITALLGAWLPALASEGALLAAAPALVVPWLARWTARRLNDRDPSRFPRWSAGLALVILAAAMGLRHGDYGARSGLFEAPAYGYLFGLVFGAVYGALFERRRHER